VREALGVPPEGRLAGIVASLQTAKDHETFLQAAAIVRRSLPDARFAIVGDGPLRARLERRSRELGLDSCVSFVGQQLRVAPYIAAFDVAVLSSCDHEGCSNFLLEAMALGRPLVATDVGGNAELFTAGRAGFLVPPKEPVAMAVAIRDVLQDTESAARMSNESLNAFRERFTLGGMVRAYEELYQELWAQKSLVRGGRPVTGPACGQGTSGREP
jgi:glycosyltransferase involved in cell wall biosynthesis